MKDDIICSDDSPLFDKTRLSYREFPSDYRQIRYFTLMIVQAAPSAIRENNVLEQQISEILKNAIKHGNKCDVSKKVRIWYEFTHFSARMIIEDEGEGFAGLEKWNEISRQRKKCLEDGDFADLPLLVYRDGLSDDEDGGSSLFAACEYWNGGVVFNAKRNAIALLRTLGGDSRAVISEL